MDDGIVAGDEACVISRVHNNSEYPDTTMTLYTATDDEAAASLFAGLLSTGQYVAIGPIHGGPTLPGNDYVYGHGVSLYLRGAQVVKVVSTLDSEEKARFDTDTAAGKDPGLDWANLILAYSQSFVEYFGQQMGGLPCTR